MQQTLTIQQLKYIEAQVTEHGGSQYLELHLEFCDHLSTAIEAAWAAGSKADFEVLVASEIRKFGYAGLQVLSKNKEIDYYHRYRNQAWEIFKSWWNLPKVLLTLFNVGLIYSLFLWTKDLDTRYLVLMILGSIGYTALFYFRFKHYRNLIRAKQKTLATEFLVEGQSAFIIGFSLCFAPIGIPDALGFNWIAFYAAVILTSFWIYTFFIVPLMTKEVWIRARAITKIA